MSKQVQDAYIVAATRTPIGRSGRGYFKNTRPDDLLLAAVRSAMKQVPTLDPKARANDQLMAPRMAERFRIDLWGGRTRGPRAGIK